MNSNRARGITALAIVSAILISSCMSMNPRSLRSLESELVASNPDLVIESRKKFGLGALVLDFVDFAFVHDRRIDISKISRAEIGIYELSGTFAMDEFSMPQAVRDRQCPRRDVIMRVKEDSEYMQMAACIRGDRVTGLEVFVLEPNEIVALKLRGDLRALIASFVKASQGKNREKSETQARSGHARSESASTQG